MLVNFIKIGVYVGQDFKNIYLLQFFNSFKEKINQLPL